MKIPLALFPVGGKLHTKECSYWPRRGARRQGVYHVIDKRIESGLFTRIDACDLMMRIDSLTRAPPRL